MLKSIYVPIEEAKILSSNNLNQVLKIYYFVCAISSLWEEAEGKSIAEYSQRRVIDNYSLWNHVFSKASLTSPSVIASDFQGIQSRV